MQSKCRNLGREGNASCFNHIPLNLLPKVNSSSQAVGLSPRPFVCPKASRSSCLAYPRAGGGRSTDWEEEPSTLLPGPLKSPHRGLANPAKDCDRSPTPETQDLVRDFSGGRLSRAKWESCF